MKSWLIAGLFVTSFGFAQVPVITGVSTHTAAVNETMIIYGTNFSSTIAENRVFFGTIEGTVQSAATNQLHVVVPPGRNDEPLTVLINGLSATTAKPIGSSFTSSGVIDSLTFDLGLMVDLGAGRFNQRMLVDMDGDGKLDIIGDGSLNSAFVIARNTSDFSTGTLSFGEPQEFADDATYGFNVADMDGDGKPDVVITQYQGLTIFRNTSTEVLSFDPGVEFISTNASGRPTISDLDLNGKPDIVLKGNASKSIAVWLNQSETGVIDLSSLAEPVVFSTPDLPGVIRAADLDGDLKPEIVISPGGSNPPATVYIAKNNISTPETIGSSSFEWTGPYGESPYNGWIELVDMNNDGMLDVVSEFLMLQNQSSPDGLVFSSSASVELCLNNPPVIGDFNGDGKPDLVCNSDIQGFRNKSGDDIVFHRPIDLHNPVGSLGGHSADLNGDGKTDLLIWDGSGLPSAVRLAVLVNNSAPLPNPTITLIEPDTAASGTIVTIHGTNFGYVHDNNIVKLNGQEAIIVRGDPTSLDVIVPYPAASGYFEVLANGIKSVVTDQLLTVISPPIIESIEPKVSAAGDEMVINGDHFDKVAGENAVYFGGMKAEVTQASHTTLTVRVPFGAAHGPVSVQAYGLTGKSTDHFTLSFPAGGPLEKHTFKSFSLPKKLGHQPNNKLKLADLDLDGKADIVAADPNPGVIMIYRNASAAGNISASSFADSVSVSVPDPGPVRSEWSIQIADLDADGKSDLALLTGRSFRVYRNTSVPGAISFADPVTFSTDYPLLDFFLDDADGDGKLDIIFSSNRLIDDPTQIYARRNISKRGVLDGNSFDEPALWFTIPEGADNLAVSDINKDRKLDVIALPAPRTFIFENESTPNKLSADEVYYTDNIDFNMDDLTVSDLNNDGIMDLVRSVDYGTTNILSTDQPITKIADAIFTRSEIKHKGAGKPTIADMDGDGKPDLILNDTDHIGMYRNKAIGPITSSSFSPSITIPGNYPDIAVADMDGDGMNDLVAQSGDSIKVFVNVNQPTPRILSFYPKVAYEGEDVWVSGKFFSPVTESNLVKLNDLAAFVKSSTDSTLVFTIPEGAETGNISVMLDGMTGFSTEVLRILKRQTISFDSIPPRKYGYDDIIWLSATSSSGLPVAYASSVDSVATIVDDHYIWIHGIGTTTITAYANGNGLYTSSEPVTRELVVNKGTAGINTAMDIVAKDVYEDSEPFRTFAYVWLVPDGPQTLKFESSNHTVATIADTVITVHGPGICEMRFWHEGSKNYEPHEVTYELIVKARSQSITFEEMMPVDNTSGPFTIHVSSTSGLPVTVASTNTFVATVEGNLVTIHNAGETALIATQEGDAVYPPAEPVTRILNIMLVTAAEKSADRDVQFAPNPVTDIVKVHASRPLSSEATIRVIDCRGVTVLQQTLNSETMEINLHDFSSGIYLLELKDNNFILYKRMQKM